MCPIAGGNWNNGANAGVWTLNLNNVRGNSNNNVGFRADSATPRTPRLGDGGAKGDAFRCVCAVHPAAHTAKSAGLRRSGSNSRPASAGRRERPAQALFAAPCPMLHQGRRAA
ncbi:MAG: hypothetical protein C0499_02310 [Zymomonas sp.]|nr:hypothetical protein [Zymomonas sp.]